MDISAELSLKLAAVKPEMPVKMTKNIVPLIENEENSAATTS